MVAKAIFNKLKSTFNNRVYPHNAPSNSQTYPLSVYKVGNQQYVNTTTGPSNLSNTTVEHAVIASTYPELEALKPTIRTLIDCKRFTAGGVNVRGVFIDSDSESTDEIRAIDRTYWVWTFTAVWWVLE